MSEDLVLPPDLEIPSELVDPFTCQLLVDPVRLPTGNVFNRSTIENLKTQKNFDPITYEPYKDEDMVDAEDIKKQAEEFFKNNAVPRSQLEETN